MTSLSQRIATSFASLSQRDFRYLSLSTVALGFSQWFQQIGLGWLVLEITGSAAQLGGVTFISGIMVLLSSIPAGVVADRYNRRDVLVWTTALNVVQAFGLAVLVYTNQAQTWHLYAFGFIGGIGNGLSQPVRQTMVYDLSSAKLLTNAITVNSLAQNIARVTGPAAAGILLGVFRDTSSIFFILAALRMLAMVFTLQIPRQSFSRQGHPAESAFASAVNGLKFSLKSPLIRALFFATSVAPILVYPYIQFLAVFAKDVLHGGPELYGVLATGVGWGSLVGLSLLAIMGDVQHKGRVYLITQFVYFGMVMAFALSPSFLLSMVFLVGAGVCNSISNVLANTLFQLAARDEMRGRVMALHAISSGLQPMGSLPMGLAVEHWGAPMGTAAFMVTGMAVITVMAAIFPELRHTKPATAEEENSPVAGTPITS